MFHLIKQAQNGSDQAFLSLFQMFEQDLYRIAFLYVKNQSDALDVVQETAYRSFKSIKQLKEANFFKTWLIRIAIHCSLDLLRKQEKIALMKPNVEEVGFVTVNEDVELEWTIRDLIEQLNENEKSVIILKFYEDLTINEVAQTLDMPIGTVKTVLYRALRKLRIKLKGVNIHE